MSESQKPVGYGHDHKGAAGGATVGGGKPGVAHTVAADKSAGEGQGTTAQTFFMDDKEIDIRAGETIFRAGRRHDIKLPHLCYSPKPGYRPDGNCRVCMVEIEGERVLAASCLRTPSPGMKVKTQTDRAKTARRMVAELLMTDQPDLAHAHDPDSRALEDRQAPEDRARPLPQARADRSAAAGPQPPGDGGQPRRLHPVQSLRPRLPRGAGQRRHRHGRPRPSGKDRVRLRRPDGRHRLASPAANACRPARPAR